ncbi:MAG TPA: HNH endonuclease [Polyangium sp.]|nr:HNH endonuclease [Polyangium sp.]
MNHPRFRAMVSFWLMVCMLLSFLPLGCNSFQLRHPTARLGQPYLPRETEERFKECAALVHKDADLARRSVDAKIKVDEDGRVIEATTTGEPNPEVGICIRDTLRNMHVDPDVIQEASLRSTRLPLSTAEAAPSRAFVGQADPVTITVVTIVYVEVIVIEEVLLTLGIGVTASVALHAARDTAGASSSKTSRAARKPHQPVAKKWLDAGGSIDQKADGTTTFTRSDGVSVTYDKAGFPDFTRYRHPTVRDVQIEFTGSYPKDFAAADTAAGITAQKRDDEGYTWHHHQDGKTMQLIKKDVHKDFFHTGGMSGARK